MGPRGSPQYKEALMCCRNQTQKLTPRTVRMLRDRQGYFSGM